MITKGTLVLLQRIFTILTDEADDVAGERDKLTAEVDRKAEQAALKRGWMEDADLMASPEERAAEDYRRVLTELAEEIGRFIEHALEKLGLLLEELKEPQAA
jgi:hypothetical protein